MSDAGEAEVALRNLAAKIERTHPDAAASLREGLTDTITINRLGVTSTLAKTLSTTNPMELVLQLMLQPAVFLPAQNEPCRPPSTPVPSATPVLGADPTLHHRVRHARAVRRSFITSEERSSDRAGAQKNRNCDGGQRIRKTFPTM
jgi:hypothetical protein